MIKCDRFSLSVSRQCELLDLLRSKFYGLANPVFDADFELMALINRYHLQRLFLAVVAFVVGRLIRGIR